MSRQWTYPAVVRRWSDGDTVRLDVDLGFGNWLHNAPFRLFGVNAPETHGRRDEKVAGLAVLAWCRELAPEGSVVEVTTFKDVHAVDRQDLYGRYLALIILPDGSELNGRMVAEGYACAYDGVGRRPSWPWAGWRWPPGSEPLMEAAS